MEVASEDIRNETPEIEPSVKTVLGLSPVNIISREDWGAMDPRQTVKDIVIEPVKTPIIHVCFTHTGTETCSTTEECSMIVKRIQTEQMDIVGLPDITFSFLVGGDGSVYEGRGWNKEPHRPVLLEHLKGRGIEIGYIGHYEDETPPPVMLRTAFDFILHGLKANLIQKTFQTFHLA